MLVNHVELMVIIKKCRMEAFLVLIWCYVKLTLLDLMMLKENESKSFICEVRNLVRNIVRQDVTTI